MYVFSISRRVQLELMSCSPSLALSLYSTPRLVGLRKRDFRRRFPTRLHLSATATARFSSVQPPASSRRLRSHFHALPVVLQTLFRYRQSLGFGNFVPLFVVVATRRSFLPFCPRSCSPKLYCHTFAHFSTSCVIRSYRFVFRSPLFLSFRWIRSILLPSSFPKDSPRSQ
jgi:hypothetical protein